MSHSLPIFYPRYLWGWVSSGIAVKGCCFTFKYCLVSWCTNKAWCNWKRSYKNVYQTEWLQWINDLKISNTLWWLWYCSCLGHQTEFNLLVVVYKNRLPLRRLSMHNFLRSYVSHCFNQDPPSLSPQIYNSTQLPLLRLLEVWGIYLSILLTIKLQTPFSHTYIVH